ncbi:MAG: glycine dehydrogenase (aminomethyl-transferring), partial [Calditrichaeota bacterium]|nr:glycine dehydrogenase (aminomethyl-transferring) [Calditrichota bacterium]
MGKLLDKLNNTNSFAGRHLGPNAAETKEMLAVIGSKSLDSLMSETIPDGIRIDKSMDIPEGVSEAQYLKELRQSAAKNQVFKSYIGLGYYDCIVPGVILRNILENPSWYTAYTPY